MVGFVPRLTVHSEYHYKLVAAVGYAILQRIDRARNEHCVTHNFLGCDKFTGIASDKILNSKFDL